MSDARAEPTHPLNEVKEAVRAGRMVISEKVKNTAYDVLCDTSDIRTCLLALDVASNFHKTMPSEKRPGRMQDAYKTCHPDIPSMPVYVKFDLTDSGYLVLLSFKHDTGDLS